MDRDPRRCLAVPAIHPPLEERIRQSDRLVSWPRCRFRPALPCQPELRVDQGTDLRGILPCPISRVCALRASRSSMIAVLSAETSLSATRVRNAMGTIAAPECSRIQRKARAGRRT